MALLCLASPKGGVGKTTLAANLARELAQAGHRVIVLDLDPQNALRLHFGVALHDGGGLMPVIAQHGNWRASLRQTESGVLLLPHGQIEMNDALAVSDLIWRNPDLLAQPVREILADPSAVLIVDTPPGPSTALSALLPLTDLLLTVLLADAASIALIPAIEQGRAYGPASSALAQRQGLGFALNQVDRRTRLSRATTEAARRHLGDRLLGIVYRDENVAEAIASQKFVGDFCAASRAAQDIALLAGNVVARLASIAGVMPSRASAQTGYGGARA